MKLKGRLRLDLGLKGRYFEIETIVFTIDSKETQYCADKPTGLKFGFGYCQQMVEEESERDKGRLIELLFLSF